MRHYRIKKYEDRVCPKGKKFIKTNFLKINCPVQTHTKQIPASQILPLACRQPCFHRFITTVFSNYPLSSIILSYFPNFKNIAKMSIYHWKHYFPRNFSIICIPLRNLRLSSRKMSTNKTQRGAVENKSDCRGTFVTCCKDKHFSVRCCIK